MRRAKTALSSVLAMVLSGSSILGQDLTIRLRSDLVVVPVTVKNAQGRLVSGLTEEDFTVEEDGVRQTIEQFSIEPMPLSVVILIDSGVEENSLAAIQESVPVLVETFGDDDEVAVFRYDNQVFQILDFTSDEALLETRLETLRDLSPTVQTTGGTSPVPSPVINGVPVIPTAPTPITRDKRVLHDAVHEAVQSLRGRPAERRRIILLISDGNERESEATYEDNALSIMAAEVQIYAIGLNTSFVRQVSNALDDYTNVSGGELYYRNSSSLQPAILQIGEQARNQYVLAYTSTNQAPPDRVLFRRIDVRCEGPYQVVHKDGYYQIP